MQRERLSFHGNGALGVFGPSEFPGHKLGRIAGWVYTERMVTKVKPKLGPSELSLRSYEFVIYGPPVGYTTNNGRFYNTARKKKYLDYKKHVQETCPFKLPFEATKQNPVIITTRAYFVNGTHPDPENVHKGMKDAIFYVAKGTKGSGDKYTGGHYSSPLYDAENPRVEVTVEIL